MRNLLIALLLLISAVSFGQYSDTFITNRVNLHSNRLKVKMGNTAVLKAKDELINEANKIIKKRELYSVTYKEQIPPSGSKNDYLRLSTYAWPNPETADGLPYVSIDGKVNPEINEIRDHYMLASVCNDVYELGVAYYFTQNEKYAIWIKRLIEVFFFNEDTRMNPNFEFAQIVKGKPNSGGATISSQPFVKLIDGVQLIKDSKIWKSSDHKKLKEWFTEYLEWMLYSKKGVTQSKSSNNIGTYYTTQIAVYALFIGNADLAKYILTTQGIKRIEDQISSDGEMKLELKRATPWNYVKYNLTAFDHLVEIGNVLDIDLYNYQNSKGGSIRKMYEWLISYADGKKKWKYGGAVSSNQANIVLLRSSASKYSKGRNNKNYNLSYLEILTNQLF